jgi:intracellular multiplication protein IcmJ
MYMSNSLNLLINQHFFAAFIARENDKSFQEKVKPNLLRRDNYTCCYCGFQANQHMYILNKNEDYSSNKGNNHPNNMRVACPFCAQCHFLPEVGCGIGGGFLIALPETPQAVLNGFCHVLFCAIENNTGFKSAALQVYRMLKTRAVIVDEQLAHEASNPIFFSSMCLEDEEILEKVKRGDKFKALKLLPSRIAFAEESQTWSEEALQEMSSGETS